MRAADFIRGEDDGGLDDVLCGAFLAPLRNMSANYVADAAPSVFLALCLAGCSALKDGVVIQPIRGTEQVALYEFSISVSPDERWLAFTEWVLPKSRVFKDLPPDESPSRIATLNLKTGEVVRHTMDSIPPETLGFSPDERGWRRRRGFEIIERRFRPPGWRADTYHFQPYFQGVHVALDPVDPGIRIVAEPEEPASCSDCPPAFKVELRSRSWDLLSDEVSAVFRGGRIQSIYYKGERPYRTNLIYCLREDGDQKLVVERQAKKGTLMTIASLRVSPDERYLAYVVHSKRQAFLSGPREEVFVMDLQTNEHRKVAKHSYVGNLIWSPDGDRLYYAGGEYASDSAVYIVDVAATFSE